MYCQALSLPRQSSLPHLWLMRRQPVRRTPQPLLSLLPTRRSTTAIHSPTTAQLRSPCRRSSMIMALQSWSGRQVRRWRPAAPSSLRLKMDWCAPSLFPATPLPIQRLLRAPSGRWSRTASPIWCNPRQPQRLTWWRRALPPDSTSGQLRLPPVRPPPPARLSPSPTTRMAWRTSVYTSPIQVTSHSPTIRSRSRRWASLTPSLLLTSHPSMAQSVSPVA